MPRASAVSSTIALKVEPGWRWAVVARLYWDRLYSVDIAIVST